MKTVFDDYMMELAMSARLPLKDDDDIYIHPIEGEIFFFNESFDREVCGRLMCRYVNMEAMLNDGENFLNCLDDHSVDLSELRQIFKKTQDLDTGCLKKEVYGALESESPFFFYDNFIYVERLEIVHKHRGKGVGIHFLREALTYLARTLRFDFFIMKPYPLQGKPEGLRKISRAPLDEWQKKLALNKLSKDFDKSLKRLYSLYGKLGFSKVKGMNFMVSQSFYFSE